MRELAAVILLVVLVFVAADSTPGGDFCAYFDIGDPLSLGDLIKQFEATDQLPCKKPLSEYQWLTWKESTEIFLEKIGGHIAQ